MAPRSQTERMQDAFSAHVGQLTGLLCPSCETEMIESEEYRRVCPDCGYVE